ncbi:MAG TPA: MBL fold metallo-hydrolase [Nitrososphaerales archaeon]|nr:MBL fold metallo-hydrolase [Nitrososphaerales archaeon]
MKNFSYVVADAKTREAVIFDPAWDVPKLLRILNVNSFKLLYVINTHSHNDHTEGNRELILSTGSKLVTSEKFAGDSDLKVKDGDELKLGGIILSFLLTPGHTPESMCILIGDEAVVTGDTLFIGECGRVDIPGGNPSELFESLSRLKSLDRSIIVYPGHDYGPFPFTTLREQIDTNYTLRDRTKEEFVKFMLEP